MQDRTDMFLYVRDRIAAFLRAGKHEQAHMAVALSGGADSVALLYALYHLREEFSLTVSAIHVNHGIRGTESDEDALFCRELCHTLGVEIEMYHVDAPAHAQTYRMSLESAARELRYACFEKYCASHPDVLIATAHHADDNAETVLFRMTRGTGLRGMCGIPAYRDRYVRPCLSLRAEEMRLALSALGVVYREDSTNSDIAYTRNFVRHEVVPLLERVHEGAVKNISLMTESLSEDEMYLMSLATDRLSSATEQEMRRAIADAPSAVAKRMIWVLYERVRKSCDAMTNEQLHAALMLIKGDRPHACMSLPEGIEMYIDRDMLVFRPHNTSVKLGRHALHLGVNHFEETGECMILSDTPIDIAAYPHLNIYKLLIHSEFCFDTMDVQLFVRARKDGDAYRYGGMTHSLKKIFNDKKLALHTRNIRPVLCDDKGILWVPGFGVREDVRNSDNKTGNRIYVCYCGCSENI